MASTLEGKIYYEVTLLDNVSMSMMQIGWASPEFERMEDRGGV